MSNPVTVAVASAPLGHRLMGMAMEYFIGLGEEAGTGPVLHTVGPHGFAKVVDMYLREIGVDQPSIWEDNNGSIRPERFWAAEIADLRFTGRLYNPLTGMFHMRFGTWMGGANGLTGRLCEDDLEMVHPWMAKYCAKPYGSSGQGCFRQCDEGDASPGCHFFMKKRDYSWMQRGT